MTIILGILACAALFAAFGALRVSAGCGGSCGACAGHCERRLTGEGDDA